MKIKYIQIPRRRREGKTDYRKRKGIVVGRENFVTVSTSSKYVYSQVHKATLSGDITLGSASSSELQGKFGWKGSAKNLPASYLTGFLLGRRCLEKKLSNLVFYSGVGRFVHGSRISSLLKGLRDAGVEIVVSESIFPNDGRVKGEHIRDYSKKLEAEDKNAFKRTFANILSSGFDPREYPAHFEQVRSSLDQVKI